MNLPHFISDLKKDISEHFLRDAIAKMQTLIHHNLSIHPSQRYNEYENAIISISARYNQTKRDQLLEQRLPHEISDSFRDISLSLLELLALLEQEEPRPLIPKSHKTHLPQSQPLYPYPKRLTQLPAKPLGLVAREQELAKLKQKLNDNYSPILLKGMGGIGKTTIAKQFVYQHFETYDHIAWISITNRNKPAHEQIHTEIDAIANDIEFQQNLSINLDSGLQQEEKARLILKKLHSIKGRNLLVIDNATFSLEKLRSDLPSLPEWEILITSRKELPRYLSIEVDPLSIDQAFDLFCLHFPNCHQHTDAITELITHIGHHPLAIELFAKTSQKSPATKPAKILGLLRNNSLHRLSKNVFSEHGDREVEVYSYLMAAFELSDAELSQQEKSILSQLALLPSAELSWDLLKQIFWVDPEKEESFEDSLISLTEKGWISRTNDFSIHPLIQEVLRYHFPPQITSTRNLFLGITKLLTPDSPNENPAEKFPYTHYAASLLSFISEPGELTDKLRIQLARLYRDQGLYHDAIELIKQRLLKNTDILNTPDILALQNELGQLYQAVGEYKASVKLYESILQQMGAEQKGQNKDRWAMKANLAGSYYLMGNYEEAAKYYKEKLNQDITDWGKVHTIVAGSQSNLSVVYHQMGKLDLAESLLETAIETDTQLLDPLHPNIAIRKSNLAMIYRDKGLLSEALKMLEEALAIDRHNYDKNHPIIATREFNLALIYTDLNKPNQAIDFLIQALETWQETLGMNHPQTQMARNLLEKLTII